MTKLHDTNTSIRNEQGIIAIFTALILTVVLSIIVLGFASVAKTEDRDALNRQLNTEAYYSAESGFNDAYSQVTYYSDLGQINNIRSQNTCTVTGNKYISPGSNVLDPTSNNEYTCLLVNPTPDNVSGDSSNNTSSIFHMNTSGQVAYLIFKYANADGSSYNSSCSSVPEGSTPGTFPQNSTWPPNCPPVLELTIADITDATAAGTFGEMSLALHTKTIYLYPGVTSSSMSFTSLKNGGVYSTTCTATTCQFTITYGSNGPTEQIAKINYIYGSNTTSYNFYANAYCSCSNPGATLAFVGDQVQIDSTGRAQTELRRMQVVVSLAPGDATILQPPSYAVQTDKSVCKRLVLGNNGTAYINADIPTLAPLDILNDFAGTGNYNIDSNGVGGTPNFNSGSTLSKADSCDPYF